MPSIAENPPKVKINLPYRPFLPCKTCGGYVDAITVHVEGYRYRASCPDCGRFLGELKRLIPLKKATNARHYYCPSCKTRQPMARNPQGTALCKACGNPVDAPQQKSKSAKASPPIYSLQVNPSNSKPM